MFSFVFVIALGAVAGYLLRNRPRIRKVPAFIHLVVCVMLFFLGMTVGLNKMIMSNLTYFCGQAAVISLMSILGSLLASVVLYHLFFKKGKKL